MLDLVSAMGWLYTGEILTQQRTQQLTLRVYSHRRIWITPGIYETDLSGILSALSEVELQSFYQTVNTVCKLLYCICAGALQGTIVSKVARPTMHICTQPCLSAA